MRPPLPHKLLSLRIHAKGLWYSPKPRPSGTFLSRFWTFLGSPEQPRTMGEEIHNAVPPGHDQAAEVWRRALERVVPACVVLRWGVWERGRYLMRSNACKGSLVTERLEEKTWV